ncbi:TfuA-like protein [Curtobacterium sp. 8I-2]|uniref:TfuA-like protein n=1 Tax=Curtobacterium sp. 8I-2 TaxID=2653136 RepID=UPI001357A2FF|nr:TfuA-like protein [Curtobacterium sp. 8I-2]
MLHIYTGPTLSPRETARAAPSARVHPPVRHGDLFSSEIRSGDTVLLIDGLYHHNPALRHKEILDALARGVHVAGASSIGAMRAAELDDFGMTGHGAIYQDYRSGTIDGDDEVAVAHRDEGDRRTGTVALINLRYTLAPAVTRGLLSQSAADLAIVRARRIYYPLRTLSALLHDLTDAGLDDVVFFLSGCDGLVDQKKADALGAIRTLTVDETASAEFDLPNTAFLRDWRNAIQYADEFQRVRYQQIFNPAFVDVWPSVRDRLVRAHATASTLSALVDGEHARIFRPRFDLGDRTTLAMLLREEREDDRERAARLVASTKAFREQQPRWRATVLHDHVAEGLLTELWDTSEFDEGALERGFRYPREALDAFNAFALGYVLEGQR